MARKAVAGFKAVLRSRDAVPLRGIVAQFKVHRNCVMQDP